jgi:hypothetical protein
VNERFISYTWRCSISDFLVLPSWYFKPFGLCVFLALWTVMLVPILILDDIDHNRWNRKN